MSLEYKYNIYPSLLDAFASYINSSQLYQQYYGFSEEPAITEDEFEIQKYNDLIDKINRVPFESEAADKGTMFNEVIDCIVENRKSERMQMATNDQFIEVRWKEHIFNFNTQDCKKVAKALKGSIAQQYEEGVLETQYGLVKLYGYYDYLLPFRLVDLKTTASTYSAFKFRNNWQHIVYPFILHTNGIYINNFSYLVYKWKKDGGDFFQEDYTFEYDRDVPKLQNFVEQFIEFLEAHKDKITDPKIFNLQKSHA